SAPQMRSQNNWPRTRLLPLRPRSASRSIPWIRAMRSRCDRSNCWAPGPRRHGVGRARGYYVRRKDARARTNQPQLVKTNVRGALRDLANRIQAFGRGDFAVREYDLLIGILHEPGIVGHDHGGYREFLGETLQQLHDFM